MTSYENGRIYKLVSQQTDKIYIGSTITLLCNRLAQHKCGYKIWLNDNTKGYATSYEIVKFDDCKIELIEIFPCKNIEELKAREGHFQRLHKDILVNIRVEGRTEKEYSKFYHDTHKEQEKQWKLNNPEKVKAINNKSRLNRIDKVKEELKIWRDKNKYLVECECGLSYRKLSEARHKKEQAHLEFLNPKLKEERQNNIQKQKDETEKRKLEKSKIQITCQCGGHYSGHHKRNRHERTEQHQNYMSFKQKFKDLIEKYKNLNVF